MKPGESGRKRFRRLRYYAPLLILALGIACFLRGGLLPGWGGWAKGDFTAILEGRVLEGPDRSPVQGATVQVGTLTTTTDASGGFELTHSDFLNRRVVIQVEKEGYQSQNLKYSVSRKQSDVGTFHLVREFYLSGNVLSRDMKSPVPAVRVEVVRPAGAGGPLRGETDREGCYRVGPVLQGQKFRLRFNHPAYLPEESGNQVIRTEGENPDNTVILKVGGVISGETRTPSGEKLSGIHVLVFFQKEDGTRGDFEKAGLSDQDGIFLIQGLFQGKKVIVGEVPGGHSSPVSAQVTLPEAGEVSGIKLVFVPPEQ